MPDDGGGGAAQYAGAFAAERTVKHALEAYALEAGFAAMGVCRPDAVPQLPERLKTFVDEGRHGDMAWMAERMHWRADPAALWPAAKSVIMLAEPYTPEHDPKEVLRHKDRAAISVYAQNKDYHDIVKKRLKKVGRWLIDQVPGAEIKVFVDTAPVMEKPLAQAAGLGWQGKHTNLLSRGLGNWFFLGSIFTTVELEPDL
ncbi:MAG: tRNA epoxyqueuosine(34) reductase QueG, partial [Pseudomonadota bacterium]